MPTPYNPSRIGRFVISVHSIIRDPEVVRAVMGRCIVVRCERVHDKDIFEYIAVSPAFDEVLPGETTPNYDLDISERGKNIKFIRFPATDAFPQRIELTVNTLKTQTKMPGSGA